MKKVLFTTAILAFCALPSVAQISIFESNTNQSENKSSNFMTSSVTTQAVDIDDIADPGTTTTEAAPIVESIVALVGLGGAYSISVIRRKRRNR